MSTAATNVTLVVACLLGLAAPASAQNAEAETLFREGSRMMDTGRLVEACAAFEASNRIEPRAGTLLRLGDCHEARGQLASAWSAYNDAKARATDPRKKKLATGRVNAIEPRLSQITIVVKEPRRIEGLVISRNGVAVDPALWNRAVPVDGGKSLIEGRAPGHEPWSKTVEVPIEKGTVRVEVPSLVVRPVAEPERPTAAPPPRGLTGRRKAAIGFATVGVLVGAGAGVLGYQSQQLVTDAATMCPTTTCPRSAEANDLIERARQRALFANLGYGVAGAAIVGGGVLWLTGARTEAAVTLRPMLTSGGAGVSLRGSF